MPNRRELSRPPRLAAGDTVAIAAPSKYIYNEGAVVRGIAALETRGFKVEVGPNVYSRYGDTTATAPERAKEIMTMFSRPDVKAIVCLTGGNTASEVLDLLDYDTIRTNPTIFSGASDITHLNLALSAQAKMVSLHGMEVIEGLGREEQDPAFQYDLDLFMKCCMFPEPLGEIPQFTPWECWRPGIAEGRLAGGHLGIAASLALGKYWPSFEQTIFFCEAPGTEPEVICEPLAHLQTQGFFHNVSAMIVGKIVGPGGKSDPAVTLGVRERIVKLTEPHGFPIVGNADFGHGDTLMALPNGVLARVDASDAKVTLLEAMVE